VQLTIKPNFTWNDRWNGKSEPFWIIVDNESEILHSEFFVLHKTDTMMKRGKKNFKNEQDYTLTFFIPYEVQEGE
jgi:activating signal cointegrator complex subunit 3